MMTVVIATVAGMTTKQPDFTMDRPSTLIAGLPAILGFVPEKSLVLVCCDGGELGSVVRVDLSARLAERVDQLVEVVAAAAPSAVIAVIVDADGAHCPQCVEEHRRLTAALTAELSIHGIELQAAHVVDRVESGGRWHCADGCGESGSVDDPEASPLAVAAVLDGRRLYPRRSDLLALIAPDDVVCSEVAAMTVAFAADREGACGSDPEGRARRDVEDVMAALAEVAAGRRLSDRRLAMLGCALTDVSVRDTVGALAVGENAAEAETLWAMLSRTLPEPWRVEALVLLAFTAYARGDGPLAGVALEAALHCDPGHRLAGMLDTALQSGLRPVQIRELADAGYRLGQRLGVKLPPKRGFSCRAG